MKKNKFKAKKGMTLIEVIISVTLLSILVVPLSGLVMSSLKNNKDSEYRQKASYVGQKVLEELKAYDKITLKNDSGKYFELLDGDKIVKDLVKDATGNTFTGSFERTIYGSTSEISSNGEEVYNVEVIMEKDKIFNGDTTDSLDEYENVDFRLDFVKDITDKIKLSSSPSTLDLSDTLEDLVLEISNNGSNRNLKLYKKNNDTYKIEGTKAAPNNKILLFQSKNYNKDTNIEIKNDTSTNIEIYLIKEKGATDKINLVSTKGNVILYEEEQQYKSKANSMYNYTVIVKDKDKNILFQGSSSKNLYIE